MKLVIVFILLFQIDLSGQDAICSKYVKYELDSNFHHTAVTISPIKIPIDATKGFSLSASGDQSALIISIHIYGTDACIENRSHIMIAFDDNTDFDLRHFTKGCDNSTLLLFNETLSSIDGWWPITIAEKIKESKIRGIKIATTSGYLSALLTKETKDLINASVRCIMY